MSGLSEFSWRTPSDLQDVFRAAIKEILGREGVACDITQLDMQFNWGVKVDTAAFDRGNTTDHDFGLSLLGHHGFIDPEEARPSGFWKNFLFPRMVLGVEGEEWERYWNGFTLLKEALSVDEILQRAVFDFEGWVGDSDERAKLVKEVDNCFREACSSAGSHRRVHRCVVEKPKSL